MVNNMEGMEHGRFSRQSVPYKISSIVQLYTFVFFWGKEELVDEAELVLDLTESLQDYRLD